MPVLHYTTFGGNLPFSTFQLKDSWQLNEVGVDLHPLAIEAYLKALALFHLKSAALNSSKCACQLPMQLLSTLSCKWHVCFLYQLQKSQCTLLDVQRNVPLQVERNNKKKTSSKEKALILQMSQTCCTLCCFFLPSSPRFIIYLFVCLFPFISQLLKGLTGRRISPRQWLQFCCAC